MNGGGLDSSGRENGLVDANADIAGEPKQVRQTLASFGRYFFRREDLRRGTFAPFSRASLRPMAIACFRLLTLRPDPLFSVPFFFRCIADLTRLPAALPYLAMKVSDAKAVLPAAPHPDGRNGTAPREVVTPSLLTH